LLQQKKINFEVFDPYYTIENTKSNINDILEFADVLLIVTDHKIFHETLTPDILIKNNIVCIVDGRNCLDGESIKNKNILYKGIGK